MALGKFTSDRTSLDNKKSKDAIMALVATCQVELAERSSLLRHIEAIMAEVGRVGNRLERKSNDVILALI